MKRNPLIAAGMALLAAWVASLAGSAAAPAQPASPAATAKSPTPPAVQPSPAKKPSPQPAAAAKAAAPAPAVPPPQKPAPKPAGVPQAHATAKPAAPAPAKPAAPPAPAPVAPVLDASGLPKGLVLHFSFDLAEPKNSIVDGSGQNNQGQATGGRWITTGKKGGGFEFASPANHIKVAASPSLNPKQATYATWFRTTRSDGVWRRIFEKPGERGFTIGLAGDTKGIPTRGKVAVSIAGGRQCLSDYVVTDGSWHHLTVTFDGTNAKLYIDGKPQLQSAAFSGPLPECAEDFIVGLNRPNASLQDFVQCFEGGLDEVMVFNRALPEEEVKAMVLAVDPNAGKPLFSKAQVVGRLRQLKLLFEEGLLTDEFYEAKVSECEAAGQ